MVILDTNVIIDHLRKAKNKKSALVKIAQKTPKESLAISVISVQELYEGRNTQDKQKEEYLIATIAPLKILSYTYDIAQLAGEIARDLNRPIELADAAIAATAIVNGALLFTLNKKDFANVPDLEVLP